MRLRYVLAIDAGTSGIRCLVSNMHGRMVASRRRDYPFLYPPEVAPLGREFDVKELWKIVCDCISSALKAANLNPEDLVGICTTSQREGAVFLDENDKELYAGPNIDLRSVTEGLILDNRFAPTIHRITGHLPSLMFVPARLKWFQKNRPEIYRRISTVLSISDWLIFRLCGSKVGEICGAVEMGLADVAQRRYSPELFASLDLPIGIFPAMLPTGSCVGKVTFSASQDTGIAEGTSVVQGAPDSHCGLIGMGIRRERQVGIVSGWSTPLQMVTDRPIFDTEHRVWTGCHIVENRWILESNSGESGHALQWVKEKLFDNDGVSDQGYELMDELAIATSVGAEGALAFNGPEAMDMTDLGLRWGGFIFPIPLSATQVGRDHLARATVENVAFAIRANAEQLETISGLKIDEVRLGGGLVRNRCLKYILPAVLDKPVAFAANSETSGLGTAILAAIGSGIYNDLDEALAAMQTSLATGEPDRLMAAEYSEYYQRWLSVGSRLKEIAGELN